MRLALAAIAFVVVSPVGAQTETTTDAEVAKLIQLIVSARFVDDHCSHYRPNIHAISELLEHSNLRPADLENKYREKYHEYQREIDNKANGQESKMCDYIFDSYDDTLPELHLFVKK